MTTVTMPDCETAVRDWLRSLPGVTALIDATRIDFSPVSDTNAPFVVILRVGGGDDLSTAPLDVPLIQVDVYAGKQNSRLQATALRDQIKAEAQELRAVTVAPHVLYGARVLSDVYLPDPDLAVTGQPRHRFALTFECVVRTVPS